MHTFGDTAAGVPAFLAKLWRLVDDPDTNDLICWSKDGRSFIIQNQAKFARELLPLNYKHNNMASFIRQLNMYGFHKITSIENGGLKFDRDEMEFSHPCFKRNHPYLLEHIKRKIATAKGSEEKAALKPETVSKVLQDVKAMRGRQDNLDSRFSVMKQENEALWREIASLRQKHAKQQQIVNKLIQFLITIVQPARNMAGVKRHMQLMINDTPENSKLRKTSESESELSCGPVIRELSEELLDEVADSVGVMYHNEDCVSPVPMERPHSSISLGSQNYDYSNQSAEDLFNACPSAPRTPGGSGSSSGSDAASPGPSIIQSFNPDGSQVVYHVTEIPDAHPQEAVTPIPQVFNEENILHTPLVREQLLKQEKNRRRKNAATQNMNINQGAAMAKTAKMQQQHQQHQQQPQIQQQLQQQQQQHLLTQNSLMHRPIQIKSEDNVDPMQFLNVCIDNNVASPATPQQQQQLISPNISEDSRQSIMSNGAPNPNNVIVGNGNVILPAVSAPNSIAAMSGNGNNDNNAMGLYTAADFIDNDIPNDIFEDTSLMGNADEANSNLVGSDLEQQQRQLANLQATISNGKFSSFLVNNSGNGGISNGNRSSGIGSNTTGNAIGNGNGNGSGSIGLSGGNGGASTSAAAVLSSAAGSANGSPASSISQEQEENENNMAVAKYKKNNNGIGTRLSTLDEVNDHLDTLQDELDSLKELLKSDGYSLDNTMLMSLFNDSDILAPYGISLSAEAGQNQRKGKELISYQPSYDLSDILSINNDSNLDTADAGLPSPSSSGLPPSVLNTPYHE